MTFKSATNEPSADIEIIKAQLQWKYTWAFFFSVKTHAYIQTIKLAYHCDVVFALYAAKNLNNGNISTEVNAVLFAI